MKSSLISHHASPASTTSPWSPAHPPPVVPSPILCCGTSQPGHHCGIMVPPSHRTAVVPPSRSGVHSCLPLCSGTGRVRGSPHPRAPETAETPLQHVPTVGGSVTAEIPPHHCDLLRLAHQQMVQLLAPAPAQGIHEEKLNFSCKRSRMLLASPRSGGWLLAAARMGTGKRVRFPHTQQT